MPKREVDDYYNNIGISSEHYDDDGTYWFTSDNGKRIGIKKDQNLEQALDNSGIPDDGKDYSDVTASDIANQEDDSQDVDDWKPEQDLQDDPDDNEYPEEEEPVPQTPEGTFGAPTADIIKDWTEDQLESAKKSMPAYRDIYDKELKKRIEDKQKSDGDGGFTDEQKSALDDYVERYGKNDWDSIFRYSDKHWTDEPEAGWSADTHLPKAILDKFPEDFDEEEILVYVQDKTNSMYDYDADKDEMIDKGEQANKREEASKWDEIKKEEITDETKKWSYKFARSKHNTNKKKPRELQEKQTKYDKLKNFDNEIWDENNFESGKDVYTHDGMSKYKKTLDNKLGGNLKFIDEEIEEWLTDENHHSLNQAVSELKSGIKDGEIEDWWDNSNEESKAKVLGDISYWDNKERKEKLNQSYDDSVMQSHIRLMYTINKKTEGESYAKEWGYEDWEEEYFEFEDWIENGEHYGYLRICKLCGMRHEAHKIGEQREHLINKHGFSLNELEGQIPTYESKATEDDDLDEYGHNVNEDESSIWDLFKDNVPKSKEGIDKSQPFIPARASDCPFNPDGRNHEFIKDQNSNVTCKHCGEEVTDYEVKLWGESKAVEGYVVFTSDGITQERHKEEWEAKDHAELIGGYVQKEISDDDWDLGKHYSISRDGDLGDIVYDARESKATELSPEAQCPKCGSYKTILEGKSSLGYGKRRQYVCTNCYNVFQSEHSPKEIRAMYGDHTSPYDRNRWGESKATESEKLECPNCKEKGGLFESTFAKNGYLCEYCDADITDEAIADWNDVDWLDLDNLLDAKESKATENDYTKQCLSCGAWGKKSDMTHYDAERVTYEDYTTRDFPSGWVHNYHMADGQWYEDEGVLKQIDSEPIYESKATEQQSVKSSQVFRNYNYPDGLTRNEITGLPLKSKQCKICGQELTIDNDIFAEKHLEDEHGFKIVYGESKYTIEDDFDESDQNDGEIQEKYVRGYENDWKDKLDTWDGRAVSDNFTTVQPYDPVNPKYECVYCNKEFSWDDTFTHDGSHGTLPHPFEDMGNNIS